MDRVLIEYIARLKYEEIVIFRLNEFDEQNVRFCIPFLLVLYRETQN